MFTAYGVRGDFSRAWLSGHGGLNVLMYFEVYHDKRSFYLLIFSRMQKSSLSTRHSIWVYGIFGIWGNSFLMRW